MDEVPASPEIIRKTSRTKTLSFKHRASLSLHRKKVPVPYVEESTGSQPEGTKSEIYRNESIKHLVTHKENNLLYFDVETDKIALTSEDPLISAAILEKANQIELENVPSTSRSFLANVKNRFVKVDEVIDPVKEPVVTEPAAKIKDVPMRKKANYSYTQLDLNTQMLGICEAADILAGLETNPEHELKDWSSPLKVPDAECVFHSADVQLQEIPPRSKDKWSNIRQSSFSRNTISNPECKTYSYISTNDITVDFNDDSDSEMVIDYSKIQSLQIRKRLKKIQNYIDSPPQAVRKSVTRKTFSKKKSVDALQTPGVVRRLSYESVASEQTQRIDIEPDNISSDDDGCLDNLQPAHLIEEQLQTSAEGDNFDASLLIKENINQLSQFFLNAVQPKISANESESIDSSSITLPLEQISSPQTLDIARLFENNFDSESSSEEESEAQRCPDKQFHRLLDDDDDFLFQLNPLQKNEFIADVLSNKNNQGESAKCQFIKPLPPLLSTIVPTLVETKNITLPTDSERKRSRLSCEGFRTAGGSDVKISEKALVKAQAMWSEEEKKHDEDKLWHNNTDEPCAVAVRSEVPAFAGFSTAAGGSVKISEHALAKAEQLLNEYDNDNNFGFKTARGSDVKISENALAKAKAMIRDIDEKETEMEMELFDGFQTAAGTSVQVSKSSLAKVHSIFRHAESMFKSENGLQTVELSDSMNFAKGSLGQVSENTLSKDKSYYQLNVKANELDVNNGKHIQLGFQTAHGNTIKVSELSITKAENIFREIESESINCVSKRPRDSTNKDIETPLKKYKIEATNNNIIGNFSTSTPNCTGRKTSEHNDGDNDLDQFFGELDDHDFQQLFRNAEKAASKSYRLRPMRQVRLINRFEECDKTRPTLQDINGVDHWDDSFGDVVSKIEADDGLKVAQQILDVRRLARKRQLEYIVNKPNDDRRPKISDFVRRKSTNGRKTLQQFVGNAKLSPDICNSAKLRDLHVENAINFTFDMIDLYGKIECLENTEGILLGDSNSTTRLILNDHCQAGFSEIRDAFLASPGIDPTLIPKGWLENSWIWILIKLSSMERNLAAHFRGITTPENVFNQLVYRYHVEIDCAKRSVIRKMLEKDDIAGRRMVLFVSRVFRGLDPFEVEIELCDGWYPIRTVLDCPLTQAVLRGKIAIGTKLMIQGADLLNHNEACSPLEVPTEVRLKIHANSTRRTRWNIRLGLYKVPFSFVISCNDVLDRGGLVVSLMVVVVRIYPLMYVDKTQRDALGSVLRSERVEKRRAQESDINRFENLQALFSQMQKEVEAEIAPTNVRFLNSRVTPSTTTAELLEMVESGLDFSCIEIELTATQRAAIIDYQRRKQEECLQEVNRRVKERMNCQANKRKVSSLLKVRVVDARKPEKVLLLSIWRPPEELCNLLLEQKVYEIRNVTANGTRNGEIQLTAGKNSSFEPSNRRLSELPVELVRQCTKIADIECSNFRPHFNEFDTVGIVVQIGSLESKKFQTVFVADAEMNLLCINFWSGIKAYAYEDVIKERTILYMSNLQWRTINALNVIPNCFATEYTTFSEHCKQESSLEELQRLQTALKNANQEYFYEQCKLKIGELKDKKIPRTNGTSTSMRNYSTTTPIRSVLGSLNSNAATTPADFSPGVGQPVSIQKRKLEQLSAYKSPPKMSPIVMRNNPQVKKNFKTPARLEDRIAQVGMDDSF